MQIRSESRFISAHDGPETIEPDERIIFDVDADNDVWLHIFDRHGVEQVGTFELSPEDAEQLGIQLIGYAMKAKGVRICRQWYREELEAFSSPNKAAQA